MSAPLGSASDDSPCVPGTHSSLGRQPYLCAYRCESDRPSPPHKEVCFTVLRSRNSAGELRWGRVVNTFLAEECLSWANAEERIMGAPCEGLMLGEA